MLKKTRKICMWMVFLLITMMLLAGCGTKKEEPAPESSSEETAPAKLKVALLLPGPINDNGWNSTAYKGLVNAEKDLGVEVAYRESVAPSDFESAFRAYAQQKYDVIIAHGNQFNDAAKVVCTEFPDTKFIVTSSDITQAPNLASMNVLSDQNGFLGGVVAAYATQTKKVAFIGGVEIPPILDGGYGFVAGVKYVDPTIEVMKTNIGSWDDVAKAKETAKAFIQQGTDVLLGDANQAGLGVINAAQEAGVLALGWGDDQSTVAPETVIASCLQLYPNAIPYVVKIIQDGNFEAKFYPMGVKEGAVDILLNPALVSKLQPGAEEKIKQVVEDIKSGKITEFQVK